MKQFMRIMEQVEDLNERLRTAEHAAEAAAMSAEEAEFEARDIQDTLDLLFNSLRDLEEEMVSADAVGLLEDAQTRMEVVADQLEQVDDTTVQEEVSSLRYQAEDIKDWLNKNYYR